MKHLIVFFMKHIGCVVTVHSQYMLNYLELGVSSGLLQ